MAQLTTEGGGGAGKSAASTSVCPAIWQVRDNLERLQQQGRLVAARVAAHAQEATAVGNVSLQLEFLGQQTAKAM